MYTSLLVFQCNCVSISYRFWDIQRQISNGVTWPWNLGKLSFKVNENGTIRKLGYDFLFAFHSNYGRLDTIHKRDRQLTATARRQRPRFCIASRGKNDDLTSGTNIPITVSLTRCTKRCYIWLRPVLHTVTTGNSSVGVQLLCLLYSHVGGYINESV